MIPLGTYKNVLAILKSEEKSGYHPTGIVFVFIPMLLFTIIFNMFLMEEGAQEGKTAYG